MLHMTAVGLYVLDCALLLAFELRYLLGRSELIAAA